MYGRCLGARYKDIAMKIDIELDALTNLTNKLFKIYSQEDLIILAFDDIFIVLDLFKSRFC